MLDAFNNREISVLIWLVLSVAFLLLYPKTRVAFIQFLRTPILAKLLVVLVLLVSYIGLCVLVLRYLGAWDISQLKTTLLWSVFGGIAAVFRLASSAQRTEPYLFRSWVADNLKIVVAVEFVANFYSFPLIVEAALIPILATISTLVAFGESDSEHRPVVKALEATLVFFGIVVLVNFAVHVTSDPGDFLTKQTLQDFATPLLLSLMFLPFLFTLHMYMCYGLVFVRLRFGICDESLRSYAKWQAMISFRSDVVALQRWARNVATEKPSDRAAIDTLTREVKTIRAFEKKPPAVSPDDGWSPFLACTYLEDVDLRPGDYHRLFGEWFASSAPLDLGDGLLPDNVTYYVEGCESVATQLRLVLNVNNPTDDAGSVSTFDQLMITLTSRALAEVGIRVQRFRIRENDVIDVGDNYSVNLSRENFEGGIEDGYRLILSIEHLDSARTDTP